MFRASRLTKKNEENAAIGPAGEMRRTTRGRRSEWAPPVPVEAMATKPAPPANPRLQ